MSVKNLPLEKLMCPICRGILIEPVTMPCSHVLCLACFNGTMEMASLTCPLCRKRVGGWLRTAKKQDKLVNKELWKYIQTNFAEYVETKQRGEDDDIEEELEGSAPPPVKLSQPGEIRKEFEICQAQLDQQQLAKQQAELKASEEFIRKLQEEEKARQEREREDERVARELQEAEESMVVEEGQPEAPGADMVSLAAAGRPGVRQTDNKENKPGTSAGANTGPGSVGGSQSVRGPLDAFLSKGRPLQGSSCNTPQPDRTSKQRTEGEEGGGVSTRCDSITQEILHFKPINVVPVTPPKTLPDGRVLEVQLIRATPIKNLLQFHETPSVTSSPTLIKQLSTLQVERKSTEPPPKRPATLLALHTAAVPSAFKGFRCNSSNRAPPLLAFFNPSKARRSSQASSTVTSNSLQAEQQQAGQPEDTKMEVEPDASKQCEQTKQATAAHKRLFKSISPDLFESHNTSRNSNNNKNENNYFHFQNYDVEQEKKDFLLAQQLQREFNEEFKTVDRRDGSNLAYQFRNRTQSSKGVTKRKANTQQRRRTNSLSQPTLRETFRRAADKHSQ